MRAASVAAVCVLASVGCGEDRPAADAGCAEIAHGCPCTEIGAYSCDGPGRGDFQCYPTGVWVRLADGCEGYPPPRPDAGPIDGGDRLDASSDASEPMDASVPDAGGSVDAAPAPDVGTSRDAGPPAIDAGSDGGVPAEMRYCVDIFVSNTCEMSVTPTEITIPRDQIAYFCWRNTSRDYPVDVWLSYGGGYTDLAPGATWNEPPGHCLGPLVHDEYADISTACSEHRFLIHCL